jgi:hypothetical protein
MSSPMAGDGPLPELEQTVQTELKLAATEPADETIPDPAAERYEARLRSLLGAVEALERES